MFNFKIYTFISLGLVAFWYIMADGRAPIFWPSFSLVEAKTETGLLEPNTLVINEQKIKVDIAATPEKRTRGFAGYEYLPDGTGFLYVFDEPDFYSFWLKDVTFPIDIVWISYYHDVVDIAAYLTPQTSPKILEPKKPAKYILILPAGATEKLRLEIGDEVLGL
jgi:hypothetical protein